MTAEFIKLNDNDTKELRKEIGLPVTKGLIYWYKSETHVWKQTTVTNYEVVETYEPSESKSIVITLEDGKRIRILGDYLADMQKPSFLSDIGENIEITKKVSAKVGKN